MPLNCILSDFLECDWPYIWISCQMCGLFEEQAFEHTFFFLTSAPAPQNAWAPRCHVAWTRYFLTLWRSTYKRKKQTGKKYFSWTLYTLYCWQLSSVLLHQLSNADLLQSKNKARYKYNMFVYIITTWLRAESIERATDCPPNSVSPLEGVNGHCLYINTAGWSSDAHTWQAAGECAYICRLESICMYINTKSNIEKYLQNYTRHLLQQPSNLLFVSRKIQKTTALTATFFSCAAHTETFWLDQLCESICRKLRTTFMILKYTINSVCWQAKQQSKLLWKQIIQQIKSFYSNSLRSVTVWQGLTRTVERLKEWFSSPSTAGNRFTVCDLHQCRQPAAFQASVSLPNPPLCQPPPRPRRP